MFWYADEFINRIWKSTTLEGTPGFSDIRNGSICQMQLLHRIGHLFEIQWSGKTIYNVRKEASSTKAVSSFYICLIGLDDFNAHPHRQTGMK